MKRWLRARRTQLAVLLIATLILVAGFAVLTLARPVSTTPTPVAAGRIPTDQPAAAPPLTPASTIKPAAATPDAASITAQPVRSTATPATRPTASPTPGGLHIATPLPGDRLPTVRLDRLPPQAHDTIRLIARDGPFPYRQDGVVFENREGRLPRKPARYYHEYTVVTPGSPDRGARRLIRGSQDELYYTDDHYSSFRRVIP